MSVAWRTDYAVRIMYETARLGPGEMASIGVIAESAEVPYDFARQIANRLAHAGLLQSKRGSRGGFFLARPAHEISLLDIFRAMDEQPTMSLCTHAPDVCGRTGHCPIHHGVWRPLDDLIERQLASMTLAEAVAKGSALRLAAAQ